MVGKKLLLEWLRERPCDESQRSEKKTKRPAHHGTEEVTAEVRRVLGSSYTPKIKTKASQKEIQQKRREHAEKMRRSQKEQEASGSKWKPGSRNVIQEDMPGKAKQEKERKRKLVSVKEKGEMELQPSPETIADMSRLGSVFGGNSETMPDHHWPTSRSEKDDHRDITASARVVHAPPLRGEPQPFEAAVNNLQHQRRDPRDLHNQIRSVEMQRNQDKIESLAEPIPRGDLTAFANVASVNQSARQMHQLPQREGHTRNVQEGRGTSALQSVANHFENSQRSRYEGETEMVFEPQSTTVQRKRPYYSHRDPGVNILEQTIALLKWVDSKNTGQRIPVKSAPYSRDMGIRKQHWTPKGSAIIEKHQLEWSCLTPKEQRAFFKQVRKAETQVGGTGLQKDARIREKELQQLTTEELNYYKKEFKLVDTSHLETSPVVQSDAQSGSKLTVDGEIYLPAKARRETLTEPEKTRTADKAAQKQADTDGTTECNDCRNERVHICESVKITSTSNEEMALQEGISFMHDAMGITVTRPPFTVALDGDCLTNAIAIDPNINRTEEQNAEHGTAIRQMIFRRTIEHVRIMSPESVQVLQATAGVGSKEELLRLLEDYTQNGRWSGDIGDLMPQMVSSFTNTPLFVIAIDPDNNQTSGYFFNPRHIFDMPELNSVPAVLVRQNKHYNRLLVSKQAEAALTLMYKETEAGEMGIRLPYIRSAPLVSEGTSRQELKTVEKTSDGINVQNNRSCMQTPKKKADTDNILPCSSSSIIGYGDSYSRAMMDSMLAVNPSYELKIGQNIFCTKPKPQDMLCSVHSSITALMNLDSIKHAISLKRGPIGVALAKFTETSAEAEKYEVVQWLSDQLCISEETLRQNGGDAAVFMKALLDRLFSEQQDEQPVFSQDLEVQSTCSSCGGERKSRHLQMMSLNKSTADDQKATRGCIRGPACTDGPTYRTNLLNCPDAVIQVVSCRRDSGTYELSADVPYQIESMGSSPYELKFCVVHLGSSRMSGHFVTLLTNPMDREECVLVDDGKIRWLKREDFEKFAKKSYINGYEIVEPQTIPKASPDEIRSKMTDAMETRKRRDNALKSFSFFKGVVDYMDMCEYAIEESFNAIDVKNILINMLQKKTYGEGNGPLLREEEEANEAAMLIYAHFKDYEQSPWSLWKRFKKATGFYGNSTMRTIKYIEMASENYQIQEGEGSIEELLSISKSKVFGAGPGEEAKDIDKDFKFLLEHASKCQSQNEDEELLCGHCGTTDIETLFECRHCQITLCAADMRIHTDKSRCAKNRNINLGFRHTPRNHGRGEWKNKRMRLSVIRPKASGNKTQYILEETDGDTLDWVVRTSSTTQLTATYDNQKGKETVDGTMWLGEGYSKDDKVLVGAKEEVLYKDVDAIQGSKNFPVWSLVSRFYRVKETPDEIGGVNLNVHGHHAKNPNNLGLEQELELIQVASGEGNNFRMVVRRKGRKDEELNFVKDFEGNEEKPEVDEEILKRMTNWQLNMKNCVTKHHLEFEQFFQEVIKPNGPYRFRNNGDNLCWINTAIQILLSILPNIAGDLSAVMQQDSTLSGARDLPKLLLEIIANWEEAQSLNNLRNLVSPGMEGMTGSALGFLEDVVKGLNQQAPQAVKGLLSEKHTSHSRKSCQTEGCDGTVEPSVRISETDILEFMHNGGMDGHSAQNCINRKLKESVNRKCTHGHENEMHSVVTYPKRPDVFLVPAYYGTLDQESSMEVKFQGATYRAFRIIHHQPGAVNHHFCSVFDEKLGKWFRIDDYQPNWKRCYEYSESEKAFTVGTDKLFDKLGVVFYKLKETKSNQEPDIDIEAEENMEPEVDMEPEANDIDNRVNFHTATDSGQQLFLARNTGNTCYVSASMAALLGNPHIHQIFRNCADGADATEIEKYLQSLCRSATGTIVKDIREWKLQVVLESRREFELLRDFKHPTQQDAMEFIQGFLQVVCDITDTVCDEGIVVESAPMSAENREVLCNILGHTTITTTTCTEEGCTKSTEEVSNDRVLSLDIDDVSKKSVNACLNAQFQIKDPYNALLCETCSKENGQFRQQQSFSNPKKCVILQLKRFQDHKNKNNRHVIVDDFLEEGPFFGYRLTGAILHEGESISEGHYTHILRDVETGRWSKTDDARHETLRDEVARDQLKRMGYIFFYSSPDQFPPPLKGEHKRKAQAATASTTESKRKEPVQRKSWFKRATTMFKTMFRTHDGPPKQEVKIPETPAVSNCLQSEVCTPTEQEIAAKIKANQKGTHQQIIDPNEPLAVTLKAKFGHDDFRSREQMEATKAIIDGKDDVVVLMPTGEICLIICRLDILLQEAENPLPISWQLWSKRSWQ